MLAERNTDVDQLNHLARYELRARGVLPTAQASFGGRDFSIGDEVMALHNDARLDIVNGERGIVTGIDEHAQRLTLHSARDGNVKVLPAQYLEVGLLTHAYAMTIHKAQGMTCDVALTLAGDTLYQEAAYTALSRGRTENRLYLADPEPRRRDLGHAPELDDDPADHWIERALQHSMAKRVAIAHIDHEAEAGVEIGI
jgi:ATP-dependent exoDNAse (exonuclease V) alpha subunit